MLKLITIGIFISCFGFALCHFSKKKYIKGSILIYYMIKKGLRFYSVQNVAFSYNFLPHARAAPANVENTANSCNF